MKLSKITFSHLNAFNIVDINIGVDVLNYSIASVRKELRLHRNASMHTRRAGLKCMGALG